MDMVCRIRNIGHAEWQFYNRKCLLFLPTLAALDANLIVLFGNNLETDKWIRLLEADDVMCP